MVLSVPNAMHAPGLRGRGSPKSLLHERSAKHGVYWPASVPAHAVEHVVVHHNGTREVVPHNWQTAIPSAAAPNPDDDPPDLGPTTRRPLGAVVAARSGDKGGNANVGLWTDTEERWQWLQSHLTVDRFREIISETAGLRIHRYELPNLKALNFVIVGFLGDGVSTTLKSVVC